ncbi:AAA family ATPase [Alicyclobacillus fodiniaquatilis]|uniref:Nuclease SbcCD subunit C n=1 Tax=Alicyclobacillus fodiniaquatilis TaxID=1661150 RepID=A0ABW4JJC5_9BACL
MKLVSAQFVNFGVYEDETFNFTNRTIIRAKNGTGKSTIPRGVEWCLYGTELSKKNQDQRLLRHGTNNMSVTTEWVTDFEDKRYTISRIKPASGSITLLINGKKAKTGEIEALFGECKEFLSTFLPGFFSDLEPKDAKALLSNSLPSVELEEVMKRIPPNFRAYLEAEKFGMGIDSVDVIANKVRSEIKEHEQEIMRLEGETRVFEDVLALGKPEQPVLLIDEDRRSKYQAAKEQVDMLRSEFNNRESRLNSINTQLNMLKDTKVTLHASLAEVDTQCHTCGQELPKEKAAQIRKAVDKKNADIHQKLARLTEQEDKLNAEYNRLSEATEPQIDPRILKAIRLFEENERVDHEVMASYQAKLQALENASNELQRVKDDIAFEQKHLVELNNKLQALKTFAFEYVRVQNAKLDELFENVTIRLTDYNKETGEVRSTFRIEWKGHPYKTLSLSEKVKCDIEIGNVIQTSRLETMTTFVDNAESVQKLYEEQFNGQVIAAYVADVAGILVQTQEDASRNMEEELKLLFSLSSDHVLTEKVGA